MKIYSSFLSMMLIGMVAFFSSCSDDEDIFYYSFKDIEYSVKAGDGMTEYETDWMPRIVMVNNGNSTISAGPDDIYRGYHERYSFTCEDASLFNPTVGYVHVPLPEALSSNNQVILGEKEGEYSLDEVEIIRSYPSKMYDIPAKTKLTLEGKILMKKLTLTYTATFQCHPRGNDHVVTGKFVRYIPTGIALAEKYEPIE